MSATSAARKLGVRALWRFRSLAFVDRAPDHRDSVLLLGSARSGTTWLAEVINRHGDHRIVFEPLRPGAVRQLSAFTEATYLRPDDDDPALVEPMRAMLSGRIRNPWTDHLNRVVVAHKRLVKAVRANLLAAWLLAQHSGAPTVLLVRHPFAVVSSRRTLGWNDHLDVSLAQPDLVEDHLGDVAAELAALEDPLQRLVAQWCIETIVPLRMTSPDELCAVTYEELVTDPRPAMIRVLDHVGQAPDDALEAALATPSHLSRADSAVRSGRDRLSAFRSTLEPDAVRRAGEVLALFGLDEVYRPDHDLPDLAAFGRLHAAGWGDRSA